MLPIYLIYPSRIFFLSYTLFICLIIKFLNNLKNNNKRTRDSNNNNEMRVSKNRQSGFIKTSSSPTNLQPQYEPHYQSKNNESFSKFDDEFSSFCYKYPQQESQNQFSLFVFNKQQEKQTKISKVAKKTTDLNSLKQNDYKMSNKARNNIVQQDEKVLDQEQNQPQANMRETHVKFNSKKHDPIKRITTNYYSATTTYAKTNKIGADNNHLDGNPTDLHHDNRTPQDDTAHNYMSQRNAHSPRAYLNKQVGKLIKTSKQHTTQRRPIQFNKKYHQDMYENGQQYYRERQLQSRGTGFNGIKRAKSDQNLFSLKNIYTQQYVPKHYVQNVSKYEVKYANLKSPQYPSSPRIVSNQRITYQEPETIKRNYKQVSQSSVIQSEPSFLKQRLEQVERRKLELLQKKRQLQVMKSKSRHIMEEQHVHITNQQSSQHNKQINQNNRAKMSELKRTGNQQYEQNRHQQDSSTNSLIDHESLSQTSEKTQSERYESEVDSQNFTDSQNETSNNNQKLSSNHQSSSETYNHHHQQKLYIQVNQQAYNHPQASLPHTNIPKSPKNLNPKQAANSIDTQPQKKQKTSSIHANKQKKTTPLKLIKHIQKRSQQLKKQQLKQMYEKQGISVAKGGVSFDVNTKDFIYPQKDKTNPQHPQNSISQNTIQRQTNVSKESSKHNPKKQKINSKQELKRRRQLAKSYDRYTRNRIFGAY